MANTKRNLHDSLEATRLRLLALNRCHHFPRMLARSEFFVTVRSQCTLALSSTLTKIPHSLPCACCQFAISDWHSHRRSNKSTFDVCLYPLLLDWEGACCYSPSTRTLTGMSSKPSAECLYIFPFLSSGAILSSASLMSSLTSSS